MPTVSFRFNREETWQTTTVNVLIMKTQEQLETALHLKTEELKKISLRLKEELFRFHLQALSSHQRAFCF